MQDAPNTFDMPLSGLEMREEWLEKVAEITYEDGYVDPLGARHTAIFVEDT